jgi:hypothetical protein
MDTGQILISRPFCSGWMNTMKTDVFIRVFSSSELRLGFAIATVARWKMQKDVRVWPIVCDEGLRYDFKTDCGCTSWNDPMLPFAANSLKMAEHYAESDPYIICNDDNLPYGQDFVSKGLAIMDRHPDYGVISGVVVNGEGSEFELNGPEVKEIHAVGGLVFLRKGLVTEFPPLEDCFWDGERHKQVINKGFKSGYAKDLPYLHMGAHFSVANPAFFVGA